MSGDPVYISTIVEDLTAGETFLTRAGSPYTDPATAAVAAARATAYFAAATAKMTLEMQGQERTKEVVGAVGAALDERRRKLQAARDRDGV